MLEKTKIIAKDVRDPNNEDGKVVFSVKIDKDGIIKTNRGSMKVESFTVKGTEVYIPVQIKEASMKSSEKKIPQVENEVESTPPLVVEQVLNVPGSVKNVPAGSIKNVPAGSNKNVPAGSIKNVPAGSVKNVPAGSVKNVPGSSKFVPGSTKDQAISNKNVPVGSNKNVPAPGSNKIVPTPAGSTKNVAPGDKSGDVQPETPVQSELTLPTNPIGGKDGDLIELGDKPPTHLQTKLNDEMRQALDELTNFGTITAGEAEATL